MGVSTPRKEHEGQGGGAQGQADPERVFTVAQFPSDPLAHHGQMRWNVNPIYYHSCNPQTLHCY